MKHPNKKIENWNKFKARFHEASCFRHWLSKDFCEKVNLTEDGLLNALMDIRRGGKTVSVELADL